MRLEFVFGERHVLPPKEKGGAFPAAGGSGSHRPVQLVVHHSRVQAKPLIHGFCSRGHESEREDVPHVPAQIQTALLGLGLEGVRINEPFDLRQPFLSLSKVPFCGWMGPVEFFGFLCEGVLR